MSMLLLLLQKMKRNNNYNSNYVLALLLLLLLLLDFGWAAIDDNNNIITNGQPPSLSEHDDNEGMVDRYMPLPLIAAIVPIEQVERRINGMKQQQQQSQLQRLRGAPITVHQEQEQQHERHRHIGQKGDGTTPKQLTTSTVTSRSTSTTTTTSRRQDDPSNHKLINNSNEQNPSQQQRRQRLEPPRHRRRLIETNDYRTIEEDTSTTTTTTAAEEEAYLYGIVHKEDHQDHQDDSAVQAASITTNQSPPTSLVVQDPWSYGHDDNKGVSIIENEDALYGVVQNDLTTNNNNYDNDQNLHGIVNAEDYAASKSMSSTSHEKTFVETFDPVNDHTYPTNNHDYSNNNNDHLYGIVYAEDYAASKSMSTNHEKTFAETTGPVKDHAHPNNNQDNSNGDEQLHGIVYAEDYAASKSMSTAATHEQDFVLVDNGQEAMDHANVDIHTFIHIGPWEWEQREHDEMYGIVHVNNNVPSAGESDTMEDYDHVWGPWGTINIEAISMSMLPAPTVAPSPGRTPAPFLTVAPTTRRPTIPPTTRVPSNLPMTVSPSRGTTASPTPRPTDFPLITETASPTKSPIATPSQKPITIQTVQPTSRPSNLPDVIMPITMPTLPPTLRPTTSRPTIDIARLRSLIESQYPIGGVRFSIDDNPDFYQTKAFTWLKEDQQTAPLDDDSRIIQRYALACIYYATNGVGNDITDQLFGTGNVRFWSNETGWLSSESECTWFGVDLCNNDDDTVLNFIMVANQMSGVLPSETGFLSNLETLIVSGNFINNVGPVGHDWMAELSQLKVLDYSENGFFFDGIPPALYELTQLEIFDCSQNYYFGEIQTFDFPPSLEVVRVADNDFAGNLAWMAMLPSLIEVDASHNSEIIGPLPEIFNSGLRIFMAGKCAITGSIPDGIVAASNLEIFSAYDNKLSGNLEVFASLTSLKILDVHDNSFDGRIPTVLGQLGSLETLRLDSNELLGAMPQEICALLDDNLDVLGADCIGDNVIPVPCDCCTCCSTILCEFEHGGLNVTASLSTSL